MDLHANSSRAVSEIWWQYHTALGDRHSKMFYVMQTSDEIQETFDKK